MTQWMTIAEGELGQAEVAGSGDNPRIREYHASASDGQEKPDALAWCSSFAGWVMQEAGIPGTGNRMAKSWRTWGMPLAAPRYGCIVVLERPEAGPQAGHVGFFHSRSGNRINLLGGNQGNSVSIQSFPASRVIAYRWPPQVPPPVAPAPPKTSRKWRLTEWIKRILGIGGVGATGGKVAHENGYDPMGAISQTAGLMQAYGIEILIAAAFVGLILALVFQHLMKEDVAAGTYTPSGEVV